MHCSKFRNAGHGMPLNSQRSKRPQRPPKTAKCAAFRQDPSTSNTAKCAALLTNRNDFCMISMDCTSMYIYVCDRRKEKL